jgi:RecG-like helicase
VGVPTLDQFKLHQGQDLLRLLPQSNSNAWATKAETRKSTKEVVTVQLEVETLAETGGALARKGG